MKGSWRAYFELLRFPAVFTAVADVMMGYLVHRGDLRPGSAFALLVVTSSTLYLAGMVFNDAFDADVDARQRPERPIPSGRVRRTVAFRLGWFLYAVGIAAAWTIELLEGDRGPLVIAVALTTFIYLYDWETKRWSVGPLNMGFCRLLNVLLGMSLVGIVDGKMTAPWTTAEVLIAAGVGIYATGVTIFARGEARPISRRHLVVGLIVQLSGLVALSSVPAWIVAPQSLHVQQPGWYLLWAVLALVIARRCVVALVRPTPRCVQAAVRHCLRSIVVIDAAVVLGFCGVFWGCAVLLLLAPMLLLEQWFNTT